MGNSSKLSKKDRGVIRYAQGALIVTIEKTPATTTASTFIIHTDHLGGTSAVTNAQGLLAESLTYRPFGAPRIDQTYGSFTESRKYIGEEYDTGTSLNYLNARYYNGAVGRFISQDPVFLSVGDESKIKEHAKQDQNQLLMNPQMLNSYSYVGNNPITFKDPEGKYLEIGVSGTYLGWSGATGVRVSTHGINIFIAGGAGAGVSGYPVSVSYVPGDIQHTTKIKTTIGGSATYGVGIGAEVSGDYEPQTLSLNNKSYQVSANLGLGGDVYVRKEVSIPVLGGKAPEGIILDPNPSPYSTPNYISAPKQAKTQYISKQNSSVKINFNSSKNNNNNNKGLKFRIK